MTNDQRALCAHLISTVDRSTFAYLDILYETEVYYDDIDFSDAFYCIKLPDGLVKDRPLVCVDAYGTKTSGTYSAYYSRKRKISYKDGTHMWDKQKLTDQEKDIIDAYLWKKAKEVLVEFTNLLEGDHE